MKTIEEKNRQNRESVKKYMKERERVVAIVPKGTNERIARYGISGNAFVQELVLSELDRLDKLMSSMEKKKEKSEHTNK